MREWLRELAADAGARDPETLAQQLSLVLDGGLSAGALDGDPRAAETARSTARVLVDNAVAEQSAEGDGGSGGPAARDDV